jgi:hypothetical protein
MNTKLLFTTILLLGALLGKAQPNLPVKFRVEKKSTSVPLSSLDEMFFKKYYYTKPVNIELSEKQLSIVYDNGKYFTKKEIGEVAHVEDIYDEKLEYETFIYVDKSEREDTITFVIDYLVGIYQVTIPENIGYNSYIQFLNDNELVAR